MIKIKYILIVVAIIGLALFLYWLFTRKKSISFDFNMDGNVSDILGLLQNRYAQRGTDKAGLYFDIPLTTIVKNASAGKVVMENIMGSVSYNGEPVLQTKANSPALQNVEVAGKSAKSITDSVQVLVNLSTIKFFQELVKGNKPKVLYNFSSVIFGKPKNFTNQTTINKQ